MPVTKSKKKNFTMEQLTSGLEKKQKPEGHSEEKKATTKLQTTSWLFERELERDREADRNCGFVIGFLLKTLYCTDSRFLQTRRQKGLSESSASRPKSKPVLKSRLRAQG